jgi:hypothetical protein
MKRILYNAKLNKSTKSLNLNLNKSTNNIQKRTIKKEESDIDIHSKYSFTSSQHTQHNQTIQSNSSKYLTTKQNNYASNTSTIENGRSNNNNNYATEYASSFLNTSQCFTGNNNLNTQENMNVFNKKHSHNVFKNNFKRNKPNEEKMNALTISKIFEAKKISPLILNKNKSKTSVTITKSSNNTPINLKKIKSQII